MVNQPVDECNVKLPLHQAGNELKSAIIGIGPLKITTVVRQLFAAIHGI